MYTSMSAKKKQLCVCPPSNFYKIHCSLSEPKVSSQEGQPKEALRPCHDFYYQYYFLRRIILTEQNRLLTMKGRQEKETMNPARISGMSFWLT